MSGVQRVPLGLLQLNKQILFLYIYRSKQSCDTKYRVSENRLLFLSSEPSLHNFLFLVKTPSKRNLQHQCLLPAREMILEPSGPKF